MAGVEFAPNRPGSSLLTNYIKIETFFRYKPFRFRLRLWPQIFSQGSRSRREESVCGRPFRQKIDQWLCLFQNQLDVSFGQFLWSHTF